MLKQLGYALIAALCALALSSGATAQEGAVEVAWDKVIGITSSSLSAAHKARVKEIINSVDNTRGCKDKIAACLQAGDQTARRHAGYVARMVQKNKTDDQIKRGIADRHESAFPEETFDIDVNDHPRKGNAGAKVVLVEYACFE